MHSKVIIASLVCMLAANFGNGKIANVVKEVNHDANKHCVSSIPNQDVVTAYLSEDYIYAGDFFTAAFNIYGSDQLADILEVVNDNEGMYEEFFYYPNGQLGVRLYAPTGNGQHFISFGVGDEEFIGFYAFTSNGRTTISTVSEFEARAKMFMKYELDYYERELLTSQDPDLNASQKREKFLLERDYNNYVYGGSNDNYGMYTYSTNGTGGNISVKLRIQWVDSSFNARPARSSETGVFLNGYRLNAQNALADSNGFYNYTLTQSQAANFRMCDLAVQFYASNEAVKVRDNLEIPYSIIYSPGTQTTLKSYSFIQYDVFMFSGFSDRSEAFQAAQAQMVPFNYAGAMGHPISAAKMYYPCAETEYLWYDGTIKVRKDHYNNWDVLNHEYGHYISDQLFLCYYYGNNFDHEIDENLSYYYGYTDGKRYAYAEGLATYIALASQMYCGDSSIYGVGDYVYDDSRDGVYVNYDIPASGVNHNQISNPAIEKTVTSILIKLMDGVSRSYDNVAIGHYNMFTNLCAFHDFGDKDINGLIQRVIYTTNTTAANVYTLVNQECYENHTFQYTSITTNSNIDNTWTIRFAEGGGINLLGATYAILTFTGVNGDTYSIQVSLPRTSYTLSSSQVQSVMNLSGADANVKAVAYRNDGTVACNIGDKLKIVKGGALEVLSHWHSSISVPSNRRYQWIVVRSVKQNTSTQQITLEGNGWSGTVAEVFDHIVPDSQHSSTKINARSNGTVPTFTKTLSYHQCVYLRVDMNSRNTRYFSVQTYDD